MQAESGPLERPTRRSTVRMQTVPFAWRSAAPATRTAAPRPALPLWGRALKRTVDVFAAGAALLITLPLLVAIAVVVRLSSHGPAIFVQTRVGVDGRKFRLFKFRTMELN